MKLYRQGQELVPDPSFTERVKQLTDTPFERCNQCSKCTAGCPVAFAMDIMPNQVCLLVQRGLGEPLLQSSTIWLCSSCETCATRCPMEISVTELVDALRQIALEEGVRPKEPAVVAFHEAFLGSVQRRGRVHELDMMGRYKLRSGRLLDDLPLGVKIFFKGKLPLVAERTKDVAALRRIVQAKAERKQ